MDNFIDNFAVWLCVLSIPGFVLFCLFTLLRQWFNERSIKKARRVACGKVKADELAEIVADAVLEYADVEIYDTALVTEFACKVVNMYCMKNGRLNREVADGSKV